MTAPVLPEAAQRALDSAHAAHAAAADACDAALAAWQGNPTRRTTAARVAAEETYAACERALTDARVVAIAAGVAR